MKIQEAHQLALELHGQGLGARRIHKVMPSIKEGRIYSWIGRRGAKPFPEPDLTPTPILAYILGVLYGDGLVGKYPNTPRGFHYRIRLKVIDNEFIHSFKLAIEKIDLHSSRIYVEKSSGSYLVQTHSKPFYEWFKKLTWNQVYGFLQTIEMKREFIRGFYESEGCMFRHDPHLKNSKSWSIEMDNSKFGLIMLVQRILNDLGFFFLFRTRTKPPRYQWYTLRLNKQEDAKRFLTEINPCIPRKSLARLEGLI